MGLPVGSGAAVPEDAGMQVTRDGPSNVRPHIEGPRRPAKGLGTGNCPDDVPHFDPGWSFPKGGNLTVVTNTLNPLEEEWRGGV